MRNVLITVLVSGSIILFVGLGETLNGQQRASQPEVRSRQVEASGTDLNGIWQTIGTADWDIRDHMAQSGPSEFGALFGEPPGQGIVEGNEIPYQPAAAQKKKENFEKRFTEDPEAKCYLPGVPRATYMPYPFQIVQTPRYILIVYEFAGAVRTIHMNEPKPNPVDTALDSWMGYSSGHWEGRTLVVEASDFNDQTWFDRAGDFHSDALRVTERYTLTDSDHIAYQATIEDPNVFTRPWKLDVPLYRLKNKGAQLLENKCIDQAEDLLYGKFKRKTNTN